MTEHLFLAGCAIVVLGVRSLAKKQRRSRHAMDTEAAIYWGTNTQVQARVLEALDAHPDGLRLPEITARIKDALPKEAGSGVVQVALNHLKKAGLVYSQNRRTEGRFTYLETYWYIVPLGAAPDNNT